MVIQGGTSNVITADDFIRKWQAAELKERSAAQEHFIDLCRLLEEPTPADADPSGSWYCFERGAAKTTGGEGWADVWKRGHFGWEYKGKRKNLNAAFAQLQQYALALENPPLLVVCDLDRFVVQTNWTNTVSEKREFSLVDLKDAEVRQFLKNVMAAPERLKPGVTRQDLTEAAAAEFAALAGRLHGRAFAPHRVAHFVNRLVFYMFAEDVHLLPNKMFSRILEAAERGEGNFQSLASELFAAMRRGGRIGFERVEYFNGGLFDDDEALPLEVEDITLCRKAAALDWGEIDPSILGTLFERGLNPQKRAQLGAHYTDRAKMDLIVEPVVSGPLTAEWDVVKAAISDAIARAEAAKSQSAETRHLNAANSLYRGFIDRLRSFRILDPACGSGNFLYVALRALKDIEHRAGLEAEALGLQRAFPLTGPENVLGIELDTYAAELARVSVWIGEIQWMRRNGFDVSRQPILRPLQNIVCSDALMSPVVRLDDDSGEEVWIEASWPRADVVIGNPPFLGGVDHLSMLQPAPDYALALRSIYRGRVAARADLVVYWFQRAAELLMGGDIQAFGFVSTKSIAKGVSRVPLDAIDSCPDTEISSAWTNEPWSVEGAAVRVSIVCARRLPQSDRAIKLNGVLVDHINPTFPLALM